MTDHFDELWNEIQRGLEGKNQEVPTGFEKLSSFFGIRKRIYSLVFGATGTGKSSFVDEAFILNPFEHYIQHRGVGPRAKPILFAQERNPLFRKSKWLIRKIFTDHGILIPIEKLLKWRGLGMSAQELELVSIYRGYYNALCDYVDIVEGAKHPTFIYDHLKKYMTAHGRLEEVSEFKKVYIPNDDDEVVIPIIDTVGNTRTQAGVPTKKDAVNKVSESLQYFRDVAGYSPVAVSQMTREKNNPIYSKIDIIEPTIDDVKESGRPGEDADLILSFFQPSRYKTGDRSYNVKEFIDPETGIDYFRRVTVLKSSYGKSDVGVGMAFMGETAMFKELPSGSRMEGFDYDSLFNHGFFLSR